MPNLLKLRITRQECYCAAGYFLLYLYIHGALLLRTGISIDEIIDFGGTDCARQIYLSNGRWGLAAWGLLTGGGHIPLAGGLTAGCILTLTFLCQCRLLSFNRMRDMALYGASSLACFQFAFMQYCSMQVEGVAFGLFTATIACYLLKSKDCTLKGFIYASLALLISISLYQTCIIYFIVLYGLIIFSHSLQRRPLNLWGELRITCGACAASLALYAVATICITYSGFINQSALAFCSEYKIYIINKSLIGAFSSSADWVEALQRSCNIALSSILQCNSRVILLWLVCGLFLFIDILKKKNKVINKSLSLFLLVLLFSFSAIYPVIFNTGIHSYLYLPMLVGGIITLTLQGRSMGWALTLLLLFYLTLCCIKASHSVAVMASKEKAESDNASFRRNMQYLEAQRYAYAKGLDPSSVRITLVESDCLNSVVPDIYGSCPIEKQSVSQPWFKQEKHKDTILRMPAWPKKGYITEDRGIILIKGK